MEQKDIAEYLNSISEATKTFANAIGNTIKDTFDIFMKKVIGDMVYLIIVALGILGISIYFWQFVLPASMIVDLSMFAILIIGIMCIATCVSKLISIKFWAIQYIADFIRDNKNKG